ncbi:hypothetical protein KP509_23G046100 [Ceratopteris richardii]|uniref:Glycosyltransferase family protein 2 n=1 Tax=Ceratopteris richardii TaxID=49495 RepID=A0A8T2RZC3_CERRI|nr:hypothetical protein KP509_23G046100 [Ceratopteris richardii]
MPVEQIMKKFSQGALVAPSGKKSVKKPLPNKQIVVTLTCLQFGFAVYATFLLFIMSPTLDLITHRNISWATGVVSKLSGFFSAPSRHEYLEDSLGAVALNKTDVCEYQTIDFEQKKSTDAKMITMKRELFKEVMDFQSRTSGRETLKELMAMPSKWDKGPEPKVTVILNHFKRKTLCAQLDALLKQTLPVHNIWVLAFGSPNEDKLRTIAELYNDSRITFTGSSYDYRYYGRFQVALQAEGADYVYIIDDDMIPGRKMLKILAHIAGTKKYNNAVLGSIGRILPFRQKDFSFPSYRKYGAKEAGIYLPDPAYDIVINRIVQVDFLSSGWFLSAEHVKALFIETPFTFSTGEDLHLSYQLQKYRDAGSFVVPINPTDKDSWGDSEHRLAQIAETTVIFKNVVEVRDNQWWRALSRGYITQWAAMHPQECDVLMYAHSLGEVVDLAPLIARYYSTPGRKAFLVVSGGTFCPCEEAAKKVGWSPAACRERRFRVFDLEVGSVAKNQHTDVTLLQEIHSSMKGLLAIHNPALVVAVADTSKIVADALALAVSQHKGNRTTSLALIPRNAIPHALWMADLRIDTLRNWKKMRISVNIITQNRAYSLKRLLRSLSEAYYFGDDVPISFNMDSKVDKETLNMVDSFNWPHGTKSLRRRIIQGGLIRAVSESWYPRDDDDYGLLLEDDIEVSPYYYVWLKSGLLNYHYNSPTPLPELSAIALYSPRLVEVVKERPKWNATEFFKDIHPNTPYLHQLPCSWGALFFPKHWREFYVYMGMRYTEDAKSNDVQIPKSRTNGWQASWKKFLIDMMYLRGYVALYPNFPNQESFSTNHMEPGAHISAADNVVKHNKEDFEVPLLKKDYWSLLPQGKLPPASKLPVINLFNQRSSIKGLKEAGAALQQDVLPCKLKENVVVDHATGLPDRCVPI